MLTNQKFPGETDADGNSKASVTTRQVSGGSSHKVEWHEGNAHRGCSAPSSITFPVDSDTQPYELHECHLDHDGNTIEGQVHDHNPAPGSLPSPNPVKKSKTAPATKGS
jgi:hypothetical protein